MLGREIYTERKREREREREREIESWGGGGSLRNIERESHSE